MRYTLEYFHVRVKEEIESWPDPLLADLAHTLELLMEFAPNIRMPHSRALGGGLFELRPHGREETGRVCYCYLHKQHIVILHAFLKKTQKMPMRELRIARSRMKEVQDA